MQTTRKLLVAWHLTDVIDVNAASFATFMLATVAFLVAPKEVIQTIMNYCCFQSTNQVKNTAMSSHGSDADYHSSSSGQP